MEGIEEVLGVSLAGLGFINSVCVRYKLFLVCQEMFGLGLCDLECVAYFVFGFVV